MDTTDLVLGLAAAAGTIYFVERGKGDDDDDARARRERHEAAHARAEADRARHEAAHDREVAADAQAARLDALKTQIEALDAKARALATMAGAATTAPAPSPSGAATSTNSTTAPAPAAKPSNGDPRRFDPIFAEHDDLPIEYLRALAARESALDPGLRSPRAWGLVQVIEVVREDYNRRHRARVARSDLLDPRTNVGIGADALRRIVAGYVHHHPDVPNLRADWNNPRFVELVTLGWNAGSSERAGVGRVARHLEQQGITDITIDLIHEHALAAGASRELARSDRLRWCKSVTALYLAERARTRAAEPAATAA